MFYTRDVSDTLGIATNRCGSGVPVVYLKGGEPNIVQTAAHEITHAIQARFALSSGCTETAWLAEATATWAEHYTYPHKNTEHDFAPFFLNEPAFSLDDTTLDKHEYGAYLWFLFVTRGDATGSSNANTQRVRRTWDALAGNNSLGAVNAAVSDIMGLKEQWPEFALYNWNRIPHIYKPYRYYYRWDGLEHKARESTVAAPASANDTPEKIRARRYRFQRLSLASQDQSARSKVLAFELLAMTSTSAGSASTTLFGRQPAVGQKCRSS